MGFEGDSIQISLVSFGLMSAAMDFSMLGENVTWTPCAAATWVKYRCVPPYTSETETTWLPAASDCNIFAVVAEPEAKARAKRACSRDAIAFSKFSLLAASAIVRTWEGDGKHTGWDSSSYYTRTRQRACLHYFAQKWLRGKSE